MYILGIESSCDDTSASVLHNNQLVSNVIASQLVHAQYGGVVPELASRAHQQNIIPVVDIALKSKYQHVKTFGYFLHKRSRIIRFFVGRQFFAKAAAYALKIPLIAVDHLEGHVLAHFIKNETDSYPFFLFYAYLYREDIHK